MRQSEPRVRLECNRPGIRPVAAIARFWYKLGLAAAASRLVASTVPASDSQRSPGSCLRGHKTWMKEEVTTTPGTVQSDSGLFTAVT